MYIYCIYTAYIALYCLYRLPLKEAPILGLRLPPDLLHQLTKVSSSSGSSGSSSSGSSRVWYSIVYALYCCSLYLLLYIVHLWCWTHQCYYCFKHTPIFYIFTLQSNYYYYNTTTPITTTRLMVHREMGNQVRMKRLRKEVVVLCRRTVTRRWSSRRCQATTSWTVCRSLFHMYTSLQVRFTYILCIYTVYILIVRFNVYTIYVYYILYLLVLQ